MQNQVREMMPACPETEEFDVEHICIGVAYGTLSVLNMDATNDKILPFVQLVNIKSKTNSNIHLRGM